MMVVMAKVVMLMLAMMVAMMDMMFGVESGAVLVRNFGFANGNAPEITERGSLFDPPPSRPRGVQKSIKMLPDPQQENLNVCKGSASISDSIPSGRAGGAGA